MKYRLLRRVGLAGVSALLLSVYAFGTARADDYGYGGHNDRQGRGNIRIQLDYDQHGGSRYNDRDGHGYGSGYGSAPRYHDDHAQNARRYHDDYAHDEHHYRDDYAHDSRRYRDDGYRDNHSNRGHHDY